MQKKSLVLNSHGRLIKKPSRYCTTESSADETVLISNPPKRQATMEDRIRSMMEQLNNDEENNEYLDAEDVNNPDIIPSSQTYSNNSLTFSDVLRVSNTQHMNRIEDHGRNHSLIASTSQKAPANKHFTIRSGTVQENPTTMIMSTSSSEQFSNRMTRTSPQTRPYNSLTFNDMLQVSDTQHENLIEDHRQNSSATGPTPQKAPGKRHMTTGPGIVGENPLTMSNTSAEQFCNVIVSKTAKYLLQLFQTFENRQDERFEDLRENLEKAHRADMKTLDDHIAERLKRSESAMWKKQTETVYPYEKPAGYPLSSLEAFLKFQDDPEQQQSLKEYLINVGGITARDTLIQFVKEAMTDSLTKQFTWTGKLVPGRSELRPLFNTSMGTVFYEALLACRNVPKPKDRMEFARLMQDAIRTAKQRLRDANRRTGGSSQVGRRRQYLSEMDEHYPSDNDDENVSPDAEA